MFFGGNFCEFSFLVSAIFRFKTENVFYLVWLGMFGGLQIFVVVIYNAFRHIAVIYGSFSEKDKITKLVPNMIDEVVYTAISILDN